MADDALRLHVPEPEVRPGDQPDFSKVPIPKAGSVPRPAVDVDPREIRDMVVASGMEDGMRESLRQLGEVVAGLLAVATD